MLWETFLTECTMQTVQVVSDGQGGVTSTWADSDTFQAAIVKNASIAERLAEKQGVSATYTITTPETITLQFHDVFKRNSDNRYFIVTSNYVDSKPPKVATFTFNQVTAEEWNKP